MATDNTGKSNSQGFLRSNLSLIMLILIGVDLLGLLLANIFLPDQLWLTILLAVILVGALGTLLWQVRASLTSRQGEMGLYSGVMVIIVVLLLGVVNFLAIRYSEKFDLTEGNIHTLSDQTRKAVTNLSEPVNAILFSKAGQREQYRPLLENYEDLSEQFNVEYVDPDREPVRARQAGIKGYNALVLTQGERKLTVEDPDEEKLTNTLIKLVKTEKQVLCWISGHGEKDAGAQTPGGYYAVKTELEDQAYEVRDVSLAREGEIPSDCGAIAVIGPEKAFFEKELGILRKYLNDGGRAVVGVETNLKGRDASPEFSKLLKEWGIAVQEALVVDPLSRMLGVDAAVPILATYSKESPITEDFQDNTYFAFARPIQLREAPEGATTQWLAKTTPKSWGETDLDGLAKGAVRFNQGADMKGPLIAAASVEGKKGTRLIVFGSAQFANNQYSRHGGNLDFFLNGVSWAMADEDMISIRKKESEPGKVELSMTAGRVIFWITFAIIPALIAISGIVIWWRRRKL